MWQGGNKTKDGVNYRPIRIKGKEHLFNFVFIKYMG